jgi:Tfp pilus assembly protein FimT
MARRWEGGTTLLELMVVLCVVAVLLAIAVPSAARVIDRITVRSVGEEIAAIFATARELAVVRRSAVSVLIDTTGATVRVRGEADLVLERRFGPTYGVRLSATRDAMTYDPRGLGYGAANLTLVARRGAAAETVLVSRLGRLRTR